MGYQVTTVTPPNIAPSAAAALPSMMIFPRFASIRRIWNGSLLLQGRLGVLEARPGRAHVQLGGLGLLAELLGDAASASAISRPRSCATTPT